MMRRWQEHQSQDGTIVAKSRGIHSSMMQAPYFGWPSIYQDIILLVNCKRAGLEATDHPANWTRCPERLRHIGNLRDKTKSRSKPKSAKPLPGNNSTPVPTSSNNINRYRPLADTTPSIENILQSAQQRHMNRITEETAQQALADMQKTLSK